MRLKRKKKKKDSFNFGIEDSFKYANTVMGIAIGTQILKGVGK